MRQHNNEVRKMLKDDKAYDSYAKHFASVWKDRGNPTQGMIRGMIHHTILWQGDPIKVVKSFGKPNCTLCVRERIEIIKHARKNPTKLINSCSEIHGACRHKPKFHRYKGKEQISADEGPEPEKVINTVNNCNNNWGASRTGSVRRQSTDGMPTCSFITV